MNLVLDFLTLESNITINLTMSDASNTNLANEPNFSSSNLNRNSVQFKVKFPDSTTLIRPDTITKRIFFYSFLKL